MRCQRLLQLPAEHVAQRWPHVAAELEFDTTFGQPDQPAPARDRDPHPRRLELGVAALQAKRVVVGQEVGTGRARRSKRV
jgi:hypothetical protein